MSNREELIDAAESAMDNVHDMDVTFRQYAEASTDAIIAAIVSGIPDLVWEHLSDSHYRCKIHQNYSIRVETYGGGWLVNWSAPGISDTLIDGSFHSSDAAKDAANAHHRDTIAKAAGLMI